MMLINRIGFQIRCKIVEWHDRRLLDSLGVCIKFESIRINCDGAQQKLHTRRLLAYATLQIGCMEIEHLERCTFSMFAPTMAINQLYCQWMPYIWNMFDWSSQPQEQWNQQQIIIITNNQIKFNEYSIYSIQSIIMYNSTISCLLECSILKKGAREITLLTLEPDLETQAKNLTTNCLKVLSNGSITSKKQNWKPNNQDNW